MTTPDKRAALRCPRCETLLTPAEVRARAAHLCRGCGGIWLGKATAAAVDDALDRSAVEAARLAASAPGPRLNTAPSLACPSCHRTLERRTVAGVEVDSCAEHGAWYDRDELPRIADRLGRSSRRAVAVGTATLAGAAVAPPATERRSDGEAVVDGVELGAEALSVIEPLAGAVDVAGSVAEGSLALVGAVFEGLFSL